MNPSLLKSLLVIALCSLTLCHLFGDADSNIDSTVFRQRKPGCRR